MYVNPYYSDIGAWPSENDIRGPYEIVVMVNDSSYTEY